MTTKLVPAPAAPLNTATLALHFDGNIVVGGEIGGGNGLASTDFKVRPDGFGRFVVGNRGLSERQAGRSLQRLFEIEAYRMMALLALPLARARTPRIAVMERSLAELNAHIEAGTRPCCRN